MITDKSQLVWRVLSSLPIEVYDEENNAVWSSDLWELVNPRTEGDYKGERTIGSANVVSAYNLLHLQLIAQENTENEINSRAEFIATLEDLQKHNLIRKRPERLRKTFRIV